MPKKTPVRSADTSVSPPRLAFVTTSGSSGKTTAAHSIAAVTAAGGRRVLVVDGDFQMDISRWLGVNKTDVDQDGAASILDVFRSPADIHRAIYPTNVPGIELLAAHPDLERIRTLLADEMSIETRLRRGLDLVEDRYDAIIIDCRAGTDIPTMAGVIAADHVIGCTQASDKEIGNTVHLKQFVARVNRGYERNVDLAGVLPGLLRTGIDVYQDGLDALAHEFGDLVLPPIHQSRSVAEAHLQRRPVTDLRRWQAVAEDFRKVAAELARRGALPAIPVAA